MHRIRLADEEVVYQLRRSARRRTIGLRISQAGLVVSVPARVPQRAWEAVLVEKSGWVLDKLEEMRARTLPSFVWRDGAIIPYLGGPIELALGPGGPRARPVLSEGQLQMPSPDPADMTAVATRVMQWYRRQALDLFQQRIEFHARQLGVSATRIGLSNARTRWGSCTSSGAIRLNWRLIKAPPAVIDYVVCHELAHIVELNHSSAFWRIVAQLCPDHALLRAALKAQSGYYHQF